MTPVLILFGMLLLVGATDGTTSKTTTACSTVDSCDDLHLNCSDDRYIFILRMQYGYKPSDSSCHTSPHCGGDCCKLKNGDRRTSYSDSHFGMAYHQCWNRQSCMSKAQHSNESLENFSPSSTFVVAVYSCPRDEDITDFYRRTTITAPAVAIRYNASDVSNYPVARGDNQTWHCQVESADGENPRLDVILVKEGNVTSVTGACSTVEANLSKQDSFSCAPGFQYQNAQPKVPFRVSVRVQTADRLPNGWAVIQSSNGSDIKVTCGKVDDDDDASTSTTSEHPPTVMTSQASSTSSPISAETAPGVTTAGKGGKQGSREGTNWTVVGAVLAVLAVVVAALAVFCCRRRRRFRPRDESKSLSDRKSSSHMPLTPLAPDGEGSGDHSGIPDESRRQHDHAAAPGLHGNTRSPEENPDYDLLGQKRSQSSSSNPAGTYGHLGEVGGGGEDTDYSYDHLARGRQAAPDVINSDYDTAALHVTSEGDYNVAGIPRKQQIITGSDYDTAEIVTSEGDYNRVDFQGKKQHVITGSDYDVAEIVTSDE